MKKSSEKPSLLQFLRAIIGRHMRGMTVGIIALVLVNSLLLFLPLFLARIIDALSQNNVAFNDFSFRPIFLWTGVFFSLNIVIFLLRLCWRVFLIFPSYKIERDIKKSLFAHIISLCKKSLINYDVGTQITLISRESSQLSEAISWGTLALVDGLFTIVSIGIILLILYPNIAWVVLLLYPVISIVFYFVWQKTQCLYSIIQERIAHVSELTRQMFTHIGDIKAHNSEKFYVEKFSKDGNIILKMQMHISILESLLWPTALFIHGTVLAITLFLGMRSIQEGSASIGDLFAIISYLTQIQQPFLGLGFSLSIQQRGISNARRINTMLHTHNTITSIDNAVKKNIYGSLQLKNVTFCYPSTREKGKDTSKFHLRGINLDIPAGTWFGITGRIGCGKSTLAMLLARIYDIDTGSLLWDGVPIHHYDTQILREHVLLQMQDFQLFSTSILQNIAFTEYEMDEVQQKAAHNYGVISYLEHDVATFVDSWNTKVGESGVRLSGGQKQRIALARTLYRKPSVLILDDIFSGLDTKTVQIIFKNLKKIRGDKTTILITHNLPILSNTSRILVMDNGEIVEDGTHDALLHAKTQYASQWKEYMLAQGEYIA